jgi:O-antigen biosynthesis protein WbqP
MINPSNIEDRVISTKTRDVMMPHVFPAAPHSTGWDRRSWLRGKRSFDLFLALILLPLALPLMAAVAALVKLTSTGPVLHWSDRVGRDNRIFRMPKFRTMQVGTPALATHLLSSPDRHLTLVGPLLRRSSLDELPQLLSIITGEMSFVGPRPALFNQHDLIALRGAKGVDRLLPGLTGWAQVNGRDDLPLACKVERDTEYLNSMSFWLDLKILLLTLPRVIRCDGVFH